MHIAQLFWVVVFTLDEYFTVPAFNSW